MGGGNICSGKPAPNMKGLSPRGRGKPVISSSCSARKGSIPAWAGETAIIPVFLHAAQVYPRVGGGNFLSSPFPGCWKGLSPRGRGKPAASA